MSSYRTNLELSRSTFKNITLIVDENMVDLEEGFLNVTNVTFENI